MRKLLRSEEQSFQSGARQVGVREEIFVASRKLFESCSNGPAVKRVNDEEGDEAKDRKWIESVFRKWEKEVCLTNLLNE